MPPCGHSATTPPWPGRSSRNSGGSSSTPAGCGGPGRPRRRRRHGQRLDPGRTCRGARRRQRPLARAPRRGAGRLAADAGVTVDWQQGDAEALPFADASFDVVMSCVGVMFAPHHQAAADELVRVCTPRRHRRAAQLDPGGLHRADVRGDEAVCRAAASRRPAPAAVGRRGARRASCSATASRAARPRSARSRCIRDRPEDFRDFFKRTYGPTIATYRGIADDPGKVAALDTALADLARGHLDADGRMGWEYLLVTARRTA